MWAIRLPDDLREFRQQVISGQVGTCHPVMLEMLYSARRSTDFERIRHEFGALATCPIGPAEWERVLEIYGLLAARGPKHQRQVGHADLLIAAAAESAGVPVLHYDADFDLIREVTGIDTRWVRPKGSLG